MDLKDYRRIQNKEGIMNELYKKTLYTIHAKWLIHEIFEYDIAKANISILLQYGYISPNEFNMYSQMNKLQRQIAIGNLQKNPMYSKAIDTGFEEARKMLIQKNDIKEEEIVSIKKDALYVTNKLNYTDFGNIHFTIRGVYSMMIKCMKLEIYFFYNEISDDYDIQVKGISDDKLYLHQPFMSLLCDILRLVQMKNIPAAMQMITDVRKAYDEDQLPIECYREFDANSAYRILGMDYGVLDFTEQEKVTMRPFINKAYNNAFLLELHKILMEMCFTR